MENAFYPGDDIRLINNGQTVFSGSLLIADISGFTEITETLTLGGREGVEELTALLNRCFDSMLGTVYRHEGSVITFSGDSILVRFPDPDLGTECGKKLIQGMRDFRRVVILGKRFSINAKAVVGTGRWNQYIIGSKNRAHILVSGGLVRELAQRELHASPCEVIVFENSSEPSQEPFPSPETDPDSFLSPGSKRLYGEHRPVTPVFVTVRQKDDHPWSVNRFQELYLRIEDTVTRHGGHLHHIDDLVSRGTRIMALFGAPVSEGRDTLNGVLAALEIVEHESESFLLSCGADSGYAFSGTIGNRHRKQYTVIGDPVNTAARLSEAAAPGIVAVSSGVTAKTSADIDFGRPMKVSLKGKRDLREAFPAVGRKSASPEEPFVGREKELSVLEEIAGKGGCVLVTGSAGVGKSSLLRVFAGNLKNLGVEVYRGFAGLQQSGTSILSSLLMNICRIDPGMTEAGKIRNFDDTLEKTGNPQLIRRRVFPGNMILRLGIDDAGFRRLPPRLRSENLLDALIMLFSSLRGCVIIEDLHRADSEELEFLFSVIERTLEMSDITFVLTTRPEGEEKIPHDIAPVRIPLEGLSSEESITLLSRYAGGLPVEDRLLEILTEKARGNPFFLVQFLLYLKEKDLIRVFENKWITTGEKSFRELPESIFSMIMARIDTLEEKTRESLKVASVVGIRFSEALVSSVVKRNVHREMSESIKAGLTFINSYIELEHIFSHMLIRDVAYESLFTERRRELHREIGNILEEKTGNDPGASAFLAMHFLNGEVWDKAVEYSIKAGKLASDEFRNREAIAHLRQASDILEKHLPDQRDLLAESLHLCGTVQDRTGDLENAVETYRKAVSCSRDMSTTLMALMSIADILFNQGNLEEAGEIVEEVERLIDQSPDDHSDVKLQVAAFKAWTLCIKGDIESAEKEAVNAVKLGESLTGFSELEKTRKLGHALNTLATVHWANSDFTRARELYERAIEIALENGLKREAAVTWGNIGLTLEKQGFYEEAVDSMHKQLKIATEVGDKLVILSAHGDLGMTYATTGEIHRAIYHASRQLELSESMKVAHDHLLALNHLATLNITLGNLQEAEKHIESAFNLLEEKHIEREMAHTLFASGKLAFEKGEMIKAAEIFRKAMEIARKVNGLSLQHLILLQMAEVHLAMGSIDAAEEAAAASREIAEKTAMKPAGACSLFMWGMIHEKRGNIPRAEKEYREAIAMFEKLGTRYYLARALLYLGTLLRGTSEADKCKARAIELFDEMKIPVSDKRPPSAEEGP